MRLRTPSLLSCSMSALKTTHLPKTQCLVPAKVGKRLVVSGAVNPGLTVLWAGNRQGTLWEREPF